MSARPLAHAGVFALAALVLAWYGVFAPTTVIPPWLSLTTMLLPLLPVLALILLRHPKAAFWGGVVSLFYFSHGAMEAWTSPEVRAWALVEVALSLLVILAASWDGMRARFAAKR